LVKLAIDEVAWSQYRCRDREARSFCSHRNPSVKSHAAAASVTINSLARPRVSALARSTYNGIERARARDDDAAANVEAALVGHDIASFIACAGASVAWPNA
jgi:hypothetical protein